MRSRNFCTKKAGREKLGFEREVSWEIEREKKKSKEKSKKKAGEKARKKRELE